MITGGPRPPNEINIQGEEITMKIDISKVNKAELLAVMALQENPYITMRKMVEWMESPLEKLRVTGTSSVCRNFNESSEVDLIRILSDSLLKHGFPIFQLSSLPKSSIEDSMKMFYIYY